MRVAISRARAGSGGNPVDAILLDTTQTSDEIYASFLKGIWLIYEEMMAQRFDEDVLDTVTKSVMGSVDHHMVRAYADPIGLRAAAWVIYASRHPDGPEFLEADDDDRQPHVALFIDAMTGALASELLG